MKTTIKIAVLAMMGMSLGVNAQENKIGNTGNVGIGILSPEHKLHVKSDTGDSFTLIDASVNSGIRFLNGVNSFIEKRSGSGSLTIKNQVLQGKLQFGTENITRMTILPKGNIGIGATNPNATLQVGDSDHTGTPAQEVEKKRLSIAPVTHFGSDWFFTSRDNSYANLDIGYSSRKSLTLRHDGNIGIGTTSPKEKLDVNGSIIIKNGHNLSWGNKYGTGIPTIAGNTASGLHFYPNGSTSGATMRIFKDGKTSFTNNMAVLGKIESKEVKVTNTPTADFVFEEDYNLPTLKSIEKHIKEKKHLPEIASAKEMEKNGVNVGDFQIQLLQKIEELTLYTIAQEKKIEALEKEKTENKKQNSKIDKQQKEMEEQRGKIERLESLVQKLLKDKN